MDFGERLKELLATREMSQRDLALRTSITEASITRYIKGERNPTTKVLQRMADALNCSVECLLTNGEILPKTSNVTIKLEMINSSPQQMAYALCEYYKTVNCKNIEYAVIDLEELAEHILAYAKSQRKMLEVENERT